MKRVRGSDLNPELRAEVLRRYVYRWTVDNRQREASWREFMRNGGAPTIPLVSDAEWLATHQFRVTSAGKLAVHGYAEPYFGAAADCPTVRVFSPPGDEMPLCNKPVG